MALPLFDRQLVRLIDESNPDRLISIVEFFDHLKEWCPEMRISRNLPGRSSVGVDSLDYSPTRACRWDLPEQKTPSARVLTTGVIIVIR